MNLAEIASALRAGGVAAVIPSCVLGDPPAATLSESGRPLDSLVDDLNHLITPLLHDMEDTAR